MEKSDAQLVAEATLGDQGSFAELVRRHTPSIYSFCYRLVGNQHAAEDCTQETFIKVWKSLGRYRNEFAFRTWIFAIARNTTTDYLRKKKSTPFSFMWGNSEEKFEDHLETLEESPEVHVEHAMTKESLEEVLGRLPEHYKTVLILHYQEGMTFQEIASVTDRPLNTVKSWHRRALETLRNDQDNLSAEDF